MRQVTHLFGSKVPAPSPTIRISDFHGVDLSLRRAEVRGGQPLRASYLLSCRRAVGGCIPLQTDGPARTMGPLWARVPRPAPRLRFPAACGGRTPEGCSGKARPRLHQHDDGHLQPRHALPAGGRGGADGPAVSGLQLNPVAVNVAVKRPARRLRPPTRGLFRI